MDMKTRDARDRLKAYQEDGAEGILQREFRHLREAGHPGAGYLTAGRLLLTAEIACQSGNDGDAESLADAAREIAGDLDRQSDDATGLGWLINRMQNGQIAFGWPGVARYQLQAIAAWSGVPAGVRPGR